MKKILALLVVTIFATAQAQTILKSDSVSCTVGGSIVPPNSVRAEETSDSTFTLYPLYGAGFVPVTGKYNTFAKGAKDSVFTSQAAMRNWLKQNNFFVKASNNGIVIGGMGWDGGISEFTADNVTTTINIPHIDSFDNGNASDPRRYWPKFFTFTASTSITQNQLDRVISFPSPRVMRIVFGNAPLTGDNITYIWSVYKPMQ